MVAVQTFHEMYEGPFARASIPTPQQPPELEKYLRAIIDALPEFVGIADAHGRLVLLNRAARALVGVEYHAEVGHLMMDYFFPERVQEQIAGEGIPLAMLQGIWSDETVMIGACGQEIPVQYTIIVHREASGEVSCLSMIAHDITARKAAEEERRRQQEELKWPSFIPL